MTLTQYTRITFTKLSTSKIKYINIHKNNPMRKLSLQKFLHDIKVSLSEMHDYPWEFNFR